MIDRQRIETIVKSNVGTLLSAELHDDTWRVHILVPRNMDVRLKTLKKTFPTLEILKRDEKEVICLIPRVKNRTVTRSMTPRPPARPAPVVSGSVREAVLNTLSELYEQFFGEPGEVLKIDDTHFKLTFPGDLRFPYRHPFLALLPAIMPDLTPAAVYTEHYGNQKRTSVYLSTRDERPKNRSNAGVSITIDGSHRPGMASYAACYSMPGQPPGYLVGAMNGVGNNAAELMAFLQGLAHLDSSAPHVTIYTDSTFVRDWAAEAGREWIEKAAARHIDVRVELIPREQNEAAHKLAYQFLARLWAT